MELSSEQVQTISSSILISDIKAYVNSHKKEYEQFLREFRTSNKS